MSVLITAASHSAAYKLEKLINAPDTIFADNVELPQLIRSGRKFLKIPEGKSPSFAHQMLDLSLNEGITEIFPLYGDELLPLSESRQLFSEYGISVMVPSVSWLESRSSLQNTSAGNLMVMQNGKILAGELPHDVTMDDEELSGIFRVELVEGCPVFTLFIAQ